MSEAKKGSTVKVHYTGKLTDGTLFDSSRDRESLEFTVGSGQMIAGFDDAVLGMKIGENKQVTIPCKDAYGEVNQEAIFSVSREELPKGLQPEVGMQLEATNANGGRQILIINEVKEDEVVLDANHPLAGKNLIFDIELMEIV